MSRSDEIIKTGGEKVNSIQVENVLFLIAGIKEAAVAGVPEDLVGEAIRAYVVREKGSDVEASGSSGACREQVAKFAVPHGVRFIEELPKTPSGKVRRRVC